MTSARRARERGDAAGANVAPTDPMRLALADVAAGRVDTDCRGATPARACDRELPALLKPAPPGAIRRR